MSFRKGLVVGKFSPLHIGHVHLIDTALFQCEKIVIITYSNPVFEGCEREEVMRWLQLNFASRMHKITIIAPKSDTAPPNVAPEFNHRNFCANLLLDRHITVDAVFSSEEYGDGFAKFMTRKQWAIYGYEHMPQVEHVCVDINRLTYPTSGTSIRQNGIMKSKYVAYGVKPSFVPRVAFLGGESSGKTTLVDAVYKELYKTHHVRKVYEFGRQLYNTTEGKMIYDDMLLIAKTQVAMEYKAATSIIYDASAFVGREPILLCDTTPATTLWYSAVWYNGMYEQELDELAKRKYALTVICKNDIPFDQDGTRQDEAFRDAAYKYFVRTSQGTTILVEGSVEERVKQVLEAINKL